MGRKATYQPTNYDAIEKKDSSLIPQCKHTHRHPKKSYIAKVCTRNKLGNITIIQWYYDRQNVDITKHRRVIRLARKFIKRSTKKQKKNNRKITNKNVFSKNRSFAHWKSCYLFKHINKLSQLIWFVYLSIFFFRWACAHASSLQNIRPFPPQTHVKALSNEHSIKPSLLFSCGFFTFLKNRFPDY